MEPPPAAVPFSRLFACADRLDWALMIVGSLAAAAHSTALVVYLHYFAKIIHVLKIGPGKPEEQFEKFREEFCKAFAKFTGAEQQLLHRLFIQVVTSLHENMEGEFESLCLETRVGATLDSIEQLVEEQGLDTLFSNKTNVMDVAQ